MTDVPYRIRRARRRRGSALVAALACSLTIAAVAVAMATVSAANHRDNEATRLHTERRLVAEAGLSAAYADLVARGTGNLGSSATPVEWAQGTFVVTCTPNADGTLALTSTGTVGTHATTLRAVLREHIRNPFFGAMFAGNSSGDPTYSLTLGGSGSRADEVKGGDIYSGGDVTIEDGAKVHGTIHAAGKITGAGGNEGASEPAPDLVGAHYEANHDVDVAAAFRAKGTYKSNALGGSAYELPRDERAHIFRLTPSDRSVETSATAKDDYFLEDPYQPVSASGSLDPKHVTQIALSGVDGAPGPNGNGKVYFIDGNLWIHNRMLYSFAFDHGKDDGIQITIVVKGNIYISDNILMKTPKKDGIALIAVKDGDVGDSGNIYFGDATFGTLEEMDAFMYAEGNFHDTNLGTTGSSTVAVRGMMSAGNQVAINHGTGKLRTQLDLKFDSRVRDRELSLPGLPETRLGGLRRTFDWLAQYEVGSAP